MNKIKYFFEQSWLLIIASCIFGLVLAVTNAQLQPRIIQNEIDKFNRLAGAMLTDANSFTIAIDDAEIISAKGKIIKTDIQKNIVRRGAYRRQDMPYIVHKYFADMYNIMKNVVSSLKSGGRFILVVGDSLIADVYVPTDLLIAKIGLDLGLKIEKIEKARERRSGQIRSYRLRESIITLIKDR